MSFGSILDIVLAATPLLIVLAFIVKRHLDRRRRERQLQLLLGEAGYLLRMLVSDHAHKHECPNRRCRTVWSHTTVQGFSSGAHNCPRCGAEQYFKYLGFRPATVEHPPPSFTAGH